MTIESIREEIKKQSGHNPELNAKLNPTAKPS